MRRIGDKSLRFHTHLLISRGSLEGSSPYRIRWSAWDQRGEISSFGEINGSAFVRARRYVSYEATNISCIIRMIQ